MATVVRMLDRLNDRLEQVWRERAAPDDVIEFATSITITEDPDDGGYMPMITIFASLHSPEVQEGAVSTILLMMPLVVLTQDDYLTDLARKVWEAVEAKRIAMALGLDDGSAEIRDRF